MTKEGLMTILVKIVKQIQEYSGRTSIEISDKTHPIGDLEGFDSLNGLEVGFLLENELGIPIKFNPLTSTDKRKSLTIEETVNSLFELISAERVGNG